MILIFYIVLLIGLLVGFQWFKYKRTQWRQTKDFKNVFSNSQIKLPSLRIGTSYSWPTFDITFSTKEDMEFEELNGLLEQFKKRTKSYYDKKFDPDRAVYCTYVGHVPVWKAVFNEGENEGNGVKQ